MTNTINKSILISFISIAIICFFLAIILEINLLFLIPFGLLIGYVGILDYRLLFLLLFATIPFSMEFYLPNGIGIDLPTEPLMLILTGIGFILFFHNFPKINKKYLFHPILWLLLLHIAWICITSITSVNPIISFKYLLAKIWYVVPFYFLSLHFLNHKNHMYQWIRVISIMLFIILVYVLIRHMQLGLSFRTINKAVSPFFRNHVNYAALIAVFIPFIWVAYTKSKKYFYALLFILCIIAVYFSYTRAAYVTLLFLPFVYYSVKWKWLKPSLWISILAIPFIVIFFVQKNNYLNYAPDYNKTIMNYDFDDLLVATYKMEDLSTMERLYRWVAGGHMIKDHPIIGFGPATFYENYKGYVVTNFQTYVSDNPEKSGIHNYLLMITVEQGIIGFIIFLSLLIVSLLIGQKVYHKTKDIHDKQIIMGSIMSLVSIIAILLINDMLEADKIGPFFFMNLSILTHYDLKITNEKTV